MKEVDPIKDKKDKIVKKTREISKEEIKTFDEINRSKDTEGLKTFEDIAKQKENKKIKTFDDIVKHKERDDSFKNIQKPIKKEVKTLKENEMQRAYNEYKEKVLKNRLTHKEVGYQQIDEKYILSPKITNPEQKVGTPDFWKYHGNDEQYYRTMAEKYLKIKKELDKGKTLDEIKKDPELQKAVDFWYARPVQLIKYRYNNCDIYILGGDGIHRLELAKQYKLGSIPARVWETTEKMNK